MASGRTFDPIWSEIYGQGRQVNRYPWDAVVSFVFRYAPRDRDRSEVRILEVGCGTGNNLWFASREGFTVTGLDASEAAVDLARQRFKDEGLSGEFNVGDFTCLPHEDDTFDLAIDRAAITNCGYGAGSKAISEVRRVLKPGGYFIFNPYADGHSSQATGMMGPDGVVLNITGGSLVSAGQICFYDEDRIRSVFAEGWRLVSMHHVTMVDKAKDANTVQSEWRVVAQKT